VRFFGRHSGGDVIFGAQIDVRREPGLDLTVDARTGVRLEVEGCQEGFNVSIQFRRRHLQFAG
jgi:hypothetical protein